MLLIAIGIIVIVIGFVSSKTPSPLSPFNSLVKVIGVLIVAAGVGLLSVKQI